MGCERGLIFPFDSDISGLLMPLRATHCSTCGARTLSVLRSSSETGQTGHVGCEPRALLTFERPRCRQRLLLEPSAIIPFSARHTGKQKGVLDSYTYV